MSVNIFLAADGNFVERVGRFIVGLFAIAGGYLIGYVLGWFLIWVTVRAILRMRKPMDEIVPKTLRQLFQTLTALLVAALVALFVFGTGGGGFGWGGGLPGGQTAGSTAADGAPQTAAKEHATATAPTTQAVTQATVRQTGAAPASGTGREAVLFVRLQASARVKREGAFFLAEGDADARTLGEFQAALAEGKFTERAGGPVRRVEVMYHTDSVNSQHPAVGQLRDWGRNRGLAVSVVAADGPVP